ncbi:MAG: hypothetical protein ACYC27_14695 [Armatimonadota bacterium]
MNPDEMIVLIVVLFLYLAWEKLSREFAEKRWDKERRDLLDRLMAKDFAEYTYSRELQVTDNGRRIVLDEGPEAGTIEETLDTGVDPQEYTKLASASDAGYVTFVGPVRPK